MKERPLLMNGAMVRATLAGTKSQTRRIVKPQPCRDDYMADEDVRRQFATLSPYGQPGDRLWVRETWRSTGDGGRADYLAPRDMQPHPVWYDADGAAPADQCAGKTRVSIHMPRWASRILLEIVSVRVERLNDCSAGDARAEGLISYEHFWRDCEYPLPDIAFEPFKGSPVRYSDPVAAYAALWESINGDGSWAANPWVWVVEFARVTP